MKTMSPQELLGLAAKGQGRTEDDLEKEYQVTRRFIDELPASNLPTKRLHFVNRPKASIFDMSKLEF